MRSPSELEGGCTNFARLKVDQYICQRKGRSRASLERVEELSVGVGNGYRLVWEGSIALVWRELRGDRFST
jgi:hypothetical protein